MKKVCLFLLCALLLGGCSAQQTLETISDDPALSVSANAAQVQLLLPEEAENTSMESTDGSKLYLCDGYSITVQTLDGGSLDKTLQAVSGYERERLTVMQTKQGDLDCYESAWSTAGEGGAQSCRTVILDDGSFHYAVTVMCDYTLAGELEQTWEEILGSVKLSID